MVCEDDWSIDRVSPRPNENDTFRLQKIMRRLLSPSGKSKVETAYLCLLCHCECGPCAMVEHALLWHNVQIELPPEEEGFTCADEKLSVVHDGRAAVDHSPSEDEEVSEDLLTSAGDPEEDGEDEETSVVVRTYEGAHADGSPMLRTVLVCPECETEVDDMEALMNHIGAAHMSCESVHEVSSPTDLPTECGAGPTSANVQEGADNLSESNIDWMEDWISQASAEAMEEPSLSSDGLCNHGGDLCNAFGDASESGTSLVDVGPGPAPCEEGMPRDLALLPRLIEEELTKHLSFVVPDLDPVNRVASFSFENVCHSVQVPEGYEAGMELTVQIHKKPSLHQSKFISASQGRCPPPAKHSVICESLKFGIYVAERGAAMQESWYLGAEAFRERQWRYSLIRGTAMQPLLPFTPEDSVLSVFQC